MVHLSLLEQNGTTWPRANAPVNSVAQVHRNWNHQWTGALQRPNKLVVVSLSFSARRQLSWGVCELRTDIFFLECALRNARLPNGCMWSRNRRESTTFFNLAFAQPPYLRISVYWRAGSGPSCHMWPAEVERAQKRTSVQWAETRVFGGRREAVRQCPERPPLRNGLCEYGHRAWPPAKRATFAFTWLGLTAQTFYPFVIAAVFCYF
jgi:hypothetical protein